MSNPRFIHRCFKTMPLTVVSTVEDCVTGDQSENKFLSVYRSAWTNRGAFPEKSLGGGG